MKRRSFIKAGGLGAVGLALGGFAFHIGNSWWDQTQSPQLTVLSAEEAEIVGSIADTLFPGESFPGGMPAATQIGIVRFYDEYLASIDQRTQKLLRVLLHGIDDGARLADATGRRFRDRPTAEREEILKAWDSSWFSARRGAWTSLKIFIAMGYMEHPEVLKACGISFHCAPEPPSIGPTPVAVLASRRQG